MSTTPGPWIVTTSNYAIATIVVKAIRSNLTIAVVGVEGKPETNMYRANAALMSIAPDMLEALIAIQESAPAGTLNPEAIDLMISDVLAKLANEAGLSEEVTP